MKLSEMSPEERREYNRQAKRRQRAVERAERMRSMIPNAHDYVVPEHQKTKLTEFCDRLRKTITEDLVLESLTDSDEYIVDTVASVLFGLEKSISQVVHDPEGMLVGGYFPDSVASAAIEHVHRFPQILQSAAFTDVYNRFLGAVAKWAKRNEQYADREFIQHVNQEIGGEYLLPPLPEPEPKPQKTTEEPLPSTAEILEQGRIELLNRIQPGRT